MSCRGIELPFQPASILFGGSFFTHNGGTTITGSSAFDSIDLSDQMPEIKFGGGVPITIKSACRAVKIVLL
ncbi:hypothetical protein C7476_109123 [Phyllobacterium bourgognense]|uniref:Uncharacterized protein n=1 Tax=Phyllobacterium bourgognense TaxID=314236 RepID=A0A368YNY3_9HYPH|nr:hypothetical protein C7476_109123 [Phyllobacterium bourgognense]